VKKKRTDEKILITCNKGNIKIIQKRRIFAEYYCNMQKRHNIIQKVMTTTTEQLCSMLKRNNMIQKVTTTTTEQLCSMLKRDNIIQKVMMSMLKRNNIINDDDY
jgi:glycyl-tRNA synthetase beta subunit